MSLALNNSDWSECSGNEFWAMNLWRSNLVAQGDKCDRRGGNQALEIDRLLSKGMSNMSDLLLKKTDVFH